MSKVAAYLRGHVNGEVSTRNDVRDAMSTDMGALRIMPEMVIYPRNTNDIRKIARFAWQLAEKGHVLPVTVRGAGTDSTGAAIGNGAVVSTVAHMNEVFEYDAKQRYIRVQPGAPIAALKAALNLQGTTIPALVGSSPYGTIGGALANAAAGRLAGKYGTVTQAISQLEVVLANGDVLQTSRVSKRELNRKKGLQGFEGDIYRGIDAVFEEYADVIDAIPEGDMTGYNAIADVRQKDGSIDLAPLFIGSQGTLGIISEMILKTEFRSAKTAVASLVFSHAHEARDAIDVLAAMNPAFIEYFDAAFFDTAASMGQTYEFYQTATEKFVPQTVLFVGFDDFNERTRAKALKKITKKFSESQTVIIKTEDADESSELLQALDVAYYTMYPDHNDVYAPAILSGFYVPAAQFEDFLTALAACAEKEHCTLPLMGHALAGVYSVYPSLSLRKISDKQLILKLPELIARLVADHGGAMISAGGEGRLKSHATYAQCNEKQLAMYEAIRKVFDPHGTLNPGVKQPSDMRTIVSRLRNEPNAEQFARFGL